ncbi:MAG: hypothetical protein AB7E72_01445 [Lysobacterales bacterium]
MILHGNQRAGAINLAKHLGNTRDNDHVTVHEIRGCVANTLPGALQEMDAISRGTRCKQFMFSVSFNPPPGKDVPTEAFTDAVDRVESAVGLEGQPRVLVFHEKSGRRHAHCVWSRVKADEVKAINLPYYKNRLSEVAKALYLDHGWDLPAGFIDRLNRNPLNFTLQEWQQANRMGDDPRKIKIALRECWAISDSKQAFVSALERQGYYLARGDRRGYVAVDWRGEVYSLSRWLDQKNKALTARLGDAKLLPGVEETKQNIDQALMERCRQHQATLAKQHERDRQALATLKRTLIEKQRAERKTLRERQEARWASEARDRSARLRQGWKGLWDKITGEAIRIRQCNEREALNAIKRDRSQSDQLIWAHVKERERINQQLNSLQALDVALREQLTSLLTSDLRISVGPFHRPVGP